ncbi:MAG: 50S ribosomal protein L6 [Methanophagales archaeon ANME-1-THS]|nr:MAG: 50S ribosomal protein L6 [Methanophagales archaeon ANME-1-THS]
MSSTTGKEEGVSIRITIPEGTNVTLSGPKVRVEGPKGTIERELWYPGVRIQLEHGDAGNEVVIISDSPRKKIRAIAGTYASHIRNMINGVRAGFFYKLAIVYAHFPMQVAVTKEGDAVTVSNFLGERKPRLARIVEGVNVEIRGKEIIVSGIDKEAAGQTATNIEQTTRIKGYDPRVFQDGIYLVDKGVGLGR